MALTAAGEHPVTRDETTDAELARDSLLALTGIDALTSGCSLLPHRRPARLRQDVLDGIQERTLRHNPWLQPPPLDAEVQRLGLTQAFQHGVNLACLTAPGSFLLPAGPLRMRIAMHLHAPLVGPGARSHHIGPTHAAPCNAPSDAFAHHTHSGGQGPRQHKHDQLRNAWQTLLRGAGWHVTSEQIVTTTAGPHRAELVTISPGGTSSALDIHVTAPLASGDACGLQLHRASLAKAAHYHTHPFGRLPGCAYRMLCHYSLLSAAASRHSRHCCR